MKAKIKSIAWTDDVKIYIKEIGR